VSSGKRKIYRLSRRGNRRLNHAIHMAAVTQVRHRHSKGRAYYDKKLAEGKTPKEALRSLKRQVSNAIYARLQADARRAAARAQGPGGQPGNDSGSSAAGLHPAGRLFGQATPGPGHHTTTPAGDLPPRAARTRGRAGHSSIAAILPPAKPRVQVERPQRSEDERPGGTARRRPQSATRKAPGQEPLARTQHPKGTSHPAVRYVVTRGGHVYRCHAERVDLCAASGGDQAMSVPVPAPGDAGAAQHGSEPDVADADEFAKMWAVMGRAKPPGRRCGC
jgi:Transposase IS116/IS110/IS902 family